MVRKRNERKFDDAGLNRVQICAVKLEKEGKFI